MENWKIKTFQDSRLSLTSCLSEWLDEINMYSLLCSCVREREREREREEGGSMYVCAHLLESYYCFFAGTLTLSWLSSMPAGHWRETKN